MKNFFVRRTLTLGLGCAMLAAAGGCATVQPWERGNLADATMNADRDPLHRTMTEHVHFSREGSTGGRGVGGGGCGCN